VRPRRGWGCKVKTEGGGGHGGAFGRRVGGGRALRGVGGFGELGRGLGDGRRKSARFELPRLLPTKTAKKRKRAQCKNQERGRITHQNQHETDRHQQAIQETGRSVWGVGPDRN
jgi:hypothetical protein